MSVGAAYAWDLAAQQVSLEGVRLAVEELGSIEIGATLSDVPESTDDFGATTFSGGQIRYVDASLIERAITMFAAQQGVDPVDFRNHLVETTEPELAAMGIPPNIGRAVAEFMRDPKSLTISFAPTQPVPLLHFAAIEQTPPQELISIFGVTVAANE